MLSIAHPWLALLLPLPFLLRWIWPVHREERVSVRAPFLNRLAEQLGVDPTGGAAARRRGRAQALLLSLAWLLVVAALVRPQWVGEPIEKIESARDLMLLVDLSGSMNETDFRTAEGERITRLDAVKLVLHDFVAERSSDRLGLLVFGDAAFLQCPLTLDHSVFTELLDELEVGMAGPRTMLGDALGLAVKSFALSEADDKTVILLTDGNDTGSMVPPTKAADLAALNDLTVHVIGVGDPAAAGEAPLDEATLRAVTESTGGSYFAAADRDELAGVYATINELEPLQFESSSYRPTSELYHWPLGAFLLATMAYHLTQAGRSSLAQRGRRET